MKILSIESSCDETAAAVIEKNGSDVRILSNIVSSQIPTHRKFGGVFPEMASRLHAEKIIEVVEEALKKRADSSLSEGRLSDASFYERSLSEVKQKEANRRARQAVSEETIRSQLQNIDVIAVTSGPGLIGSLLVGVNFAKTLSYATKKPIIGVNHLLGHIYSCFAGEQISEPFALKANRGGEAHGQGRAERLGPISSLGKSGSVSLRTNGEHILPDFPLLALIVSGGHTSLVLMKSHSDFQTIGETQDDAAGEAFDKVSKLLDLGYPGGPAIAAAAAKYKEESIKKKANMPVIKLPRPMIDSPDYNFSFSGLKTAVLHLVNDEMRNVKYGNHISHLISHNTSSIAFEFQQAVIDVLISKTLKAAQEFKPKSILLCGGVSANKELRKQMASQISHLTSHTSFFVPPMSLTTDNAAMIGLAASYHLDQKTSYDKISADANLRL